MFSSIFSNFGGLFGKFLGGGVYSTVGRFVGKWIGSELDALEETQSEFYKIGRSKDNLNNISFASGKNIPLVFGKSRVNGQLIWSDQIKEIPSKDISYRHLKNHTKIITNVEFLYYCNFALGICEGKIENIERIWINGEISDLSNFDYTLYKGGEDQVVDKFISSFYPENECPAFKDLAYIIFKDFPLIDYGNSIPLFSFEVYRKANISSREKIKDIESKVKSINIIPGSGEFVYDTDIITKKLIVGDSLIKNEKINSNNKDNISDVEHSLNYLNNICPNVEWVSPVICWFGDSMDIKDCNILPAVEFKDENTEYSKDWIVGEFNRYNARLISKDEDGSPNYGGTVCDESILNYLKLLKRNGKKIMFYPMIFMDVPGKPWRGYLSGSSDYVVDFFDKKNGYRDFIIHYAMLVKDHVDAFLIGSELIGLTKIRNSNNFPFVDKLCELAKDVKEILGERVKVSYAADWSEYHHTGGGYYNLDKLWSSPYIDFIGIDNYMPITDIKNGNATSDEIRKGFSSGEGYNYYLGEYGEKLKLDKEYAWKNLRYWWENKHYNPDGSITQWEPRLKKIWFTEFGFPSIDKATNQPNIFYDPRCVDGGVPKHSSGEFNLQIQKLAIKEFINFWEKEEYIENMFLWCFDARPYPEWPHSKKWKDWPLWKKGHWINGKFGANNLSDIIYEITEKVGISTTYIDTTSLCSSVYGLQLSNNYTGEEIIDLLKIIYNFQEYKDDNRTIIFEYKKNYDEFLIKKNELLEIEEQYQINEYSFSIEDFPGKISSSFYNIDSEYRISKESYIKNKSACEASNFHIPLSLTENEIFSVMENIVLDIANASNNIRIILPLCYCFLKANDVISIEKLSTKNRLFKIISLRYRENKIYILASEISKKDNHNILSTANNYYLEDTGEIINVDLPEYYKPNNYKLGYSYYYFINTSKINRNLNLSINSGYFNNYTIIKPNGLIAKSLNYNLPEHLEFKIIDKSSYIDFYSEIKPRYIENRDLGDSNSLIKFGKLLIFCKKILQIDHSIYRAKDFIYYFHEQEEIYNFEEESEIYLLYNMEQVSIENIFSKLNIRFKNKNKIQKVIKQHISG